jgi:hypothetical protein
LHGYVVYTVWIRVVTKHLLWKFTLYCRMVHHTVKMDYIHQQCRCSRILPSSLAPRSTNEILLKCTLGFLATKHETEDLLNKNLTDAPIRSLQAFSTYWVETNLSMETSALCARDSAHNYLQSV